ncbi:hypothetical protein Tsubulata_911877 [Turnera subulata]|uniref:Sinapine esterase n=1 Tax=Turnera subulata TaxID=218843 RepID=A0A9Q0GAZ5_9ROSI|nr:hypothetical protein Tsubulata_911877 [Turnera subulata]
MKTQQQHLLISSVLVFASTIVPSTLGQHYNAIFSFGDSLADTGNLVNMVDPDKLPHAGFPPYGSTYFHRPTGRYSDGRLVIDFIAEYVGLPFLPPYFGKGEHNFQQGVNFAVSGATALDFGFLEERGIYNPGTNNSLNVQVQWFKNLLPSLCSTPSGCSEVLRHSLIVMGEIGGNDYNYAFFQRIDVKEIRKLVPLVVNAIALAIKDLIELGAVTILVPGNFPLGCIPSFLTDYKSSHKEDYDPVTGCINWLNEFSEYHNEQLKLEQTNLRELYPHVNIIYADYYNAAMQIYESPDQFGFTPGEVLKACCGSGGPYNFNPPLLCGYQTVTSCDDPSSYASWDGLHFTEAAYRLVAKSIIEGTYALPYLHIPRHICPSIMKSNQMHTVKDI